MVKELRVQLFGFFDCIKQDFGDLDELPPRSKLSGMSSDCFYESDYELDTILNLMCMNTLKLKKLIPMSVFNLAFLKYF